MKNKRQLNRDLLLSGTYRQRVVKAQKGKGSYQRQEKHRRLNQERGVFCFYGNFFCASLAAF
ncbi:alternative ribosome rescue factor ArfA [Suttonella indologenes]|uniref:Domain of uncharacterized function n=1 Tax=Suttonella indologenes TaxID=13276 RepID=A0A380MYE2_9GAMM|nr:alternative ribosome rescue factor ArfA [Suttonella indologenes]SUO96701.1 Domain of uncharacterised function [Suttonella indologenes]